MHWNPVNFLLEKSPPLWAAVDGLSLTEINTTSQQQLLFLSRCQALLLRDGGRTTWFDQSLFPLLHVLGQVYWWELPPAAEPQRIQHPEQLTDDYAGLADSDAKEDAKHVLITHPTAPIFCHALGHRRDIAFWTLAVLHYRKKLAQVAQWFVGVFFHSQEMASIGKDIAWEIFTYALFPKLRLSVEHSLLKYLLDFKNSVILSLTYYNVWHIEKSFFTTTVLQ